MRSIRFAFITAVLLAAIVMGGCSDEGEANLGGGSTATPAASAGETLPAGLAGTWQVAVRRSELPEDSSEIRENPGARSHEFEVGLHATGGEADGPSMTIENADAGTFVLPIDVSDEQVELEDFVECRAFRYAVEGERLSFEAEHAGCAREHTLAAILTTRPLERVE